MILMHSVELLHGCFSFLLFVPGEITLGPCFIGFAIGESLERGLRWRLPAVIFTQIAALRSDLMKIVSRLKKKDERRGQPWP